MNPCTDASMGEKYREKSIVLNLRCQKLCQHCKYSMVGIQGPPSVSDLQVSKSRLVSKSRFPEIGIGGSYLRCTRCDKFLGPFINRAFFRPSQIGQVLATSMRAFNFISCTTHGTCPERALLETPQYCCVWFFFFPLLHAAAASLLSGQHKA